MILYKQIIRLVLIGTLSGVIISCDGPYDDCPEYYFSDTYKSYTVFNEGSYWVYEDTVYDVIDSMNLIYQSLTFINNCDYNSDPQERLIQRYTSSFFEPVSPSYEYSVMLGFARDGSYNLGWTPPSAYYDDKWFDYQLDSILINSYWYKDVRVIQNGVSKAYWAKDIGLIKKVRQYPMDSDTVYSFELVRYKLN